MRCNVCGEILTDFEVSLKHGITHKYLDTCKECLTVIGCIPFYSNNPTMMESDDTPQELLDLDDNYDENQDTNGYDDYWDER